MVKMRLGAGEPGAHEAAKSSDKSPPETLSARTAFSVAITRHRPEAQEAQFQKTGLVLLALSN
jgi:hypothetical protein